MILVHIFFIEATFSPSPPPKHDTTIGQSETSETTPLISKTTLQSTIQAETTMLTKSGQTETPETTPLISKTTFLSTTSQAETSSSATQPVSTANEAGMNEKPQ
ncbi:mucin-2-like [Saccostrea cucullata]|uniref:mucin-2-like n=1 Tax=Saccostrea cuccullata TaxID=36930 RepID=UPI002ED6BEC1